MGILQWNIAQPWKETKLELFVEKCIDLDLVTQSEVSQKEKNKYRPLNSYMWNLEK